ncbi:hypothetical protein SCAR479_08141 [Seiridium cardinale]|uniref:Uncharacterized protein n=1 Tax=Seiridium cardinale TaxID=138064 RepID=A0ABR2XNH6_9PEZI
MPNIPPTIPDGCSTLPGSAEFHASDTARLYAAGQWTLSQLQRRKLSSGRNIKPLQVEAPYTDLKSAQPPLVARLCDDQNARQITLIHDVSSMQDDPSKEAGHTEAHGVVIKSEDKALLHPIWAYWEDEITPEKPFWIDIVELNDYQQSKIQSSLVCWVPHLEAADGQLVTFLSGQPRRSKSGARGTVVIIQTSGSPMETKLEWKELAELDKMDPVSLPRKEALFDIQLQALRDWRSTSPQSFPFDPFMKLEDIPAAVRKDIERIVSSSTRRYPIATVSSISQIGQDRWYEWSSDSCSINTPDELSSNGEHEVEYAADEGPSPLRACTLRCCSYADLGPTIWNRGRPRHWHMKGEECSFGPDHSQHCVFSAPYPDDCVITEVPHQHCIPVTLLKEPSGADAMDYTHCPPKSSDDMTRCFTSGPTISAREQILPAQEDLGFFDDFKNLSPIAIDPPEYPSALELPSPELEPDNSPMRDPTFFEDGDEDFEDVGLRVSSPDGFSLPHISGVRLDAMQYSPVPVGDAGMWS